MDDSALNRIYEDSVTRMYERMPPDIREQVEAGLTPQERNGLYAAEERSWRRRNDYEREHGEPLFPPFGPDNDWDAWVAKARAALGK